MKILSSIFLCFIFNTCAAGEVIMNKSYRDDVHSAQFFPVGNPLGYPLLALGSSEQLEINFDVFSEDFETLNYGVIHCSHDWKPSDLASGQYIRGFATNQISDIQYSFNTLTNYIHYRFNYPTDISQPTLSGNYALVIFSGSDLSDRSTWVLSLRMVVYELQTTIRSNVHASSIIADRYTHQEIDFDLAHKGFSINDPMNDIHALIIQNFDWKRTSEFLKPIFIQPDVLTFDYFSGENTFEGCAEWRFFEMKDLRYQSSQVEHIAQLDDGYHVYLRPCVPEGKRAYSSWQDLNGNFLVKNDQGGDDQIEADYTWVHFVLTMPEISDAGVFIEGAFNRYNQLDECTYDRGLGAYTTKLLLKQGYYNYRFVLRDVYNSADNIKVTEGSYAATENDYHIIMYMYDRRWGCDRVISISAN
ncbi:MAG: DUF5103 domain-containing protein [Flavobacteriales bacterium]